MDTFDIAQNREWRKLMALSRKMPKNADIEGQIQEYNLEATKQDVKDWQESRLTALDYMIPDWTDLIRVYDDVMVDSFLTGIVESIKDNIKSQEFNIYNKSGEIKEDKKGLFEQQWFFKFLDWAVESMFYPYSVIQLGDLIDDKFSNIKLIPREYFIPQKSFIKKNFYTFGLYKHKIDGWDITQPDFNKHYICLKSNHQLGLLDKVAYHALGKKHMLIYMWRFGEIFGLPMRVGKTDITDNARRNNMENMVSNMGSSLWAVTDLEDEVNLVETKSSQNTDFFMKAMNFSNTEISVALSGSESMFKEKSFVGSAEVGERIFSTKKKSILRDITFSINNELIPRMIYYGLPLEGNYLAWEHEDNVSYDQKLQAVNTLGNWFDLDPGEVGEKLGYTLKPKTTPQQNVVNAIKARQKTSVMPDVQALYAGMYTPKIKKDERKKDFINRFMTDKNMIGQYPDEKQRYEFCLKNM